MSAPTSRAGGLAPVALAKPDLVLRVVFDGRRLGMQFGGAVDDPGSRAKSGGATWLGARRMWVLQCTDPVQAQAWCRRHFQEVLRHVDTTSLQRVVTGAFQAVEGDYFTQLLDVQIFPLVNSADHAVSFVYDAPLVDAVRSLRGRFHKHANAWEIHAPVTRIVQVLRELAGIQDEQMFVHERPVLLEAMSAPGASAAPITVPAAPAPEIEPKGEGKDEGIAFMSTLVSAMVEIPVDEGRLQAEAVLAGLRDYQVDGVRHFLRWSGALLGDDMGLGKSRQSVVAARLAAGTGIVLVVCPASLRINWEREIHAVYRDAVVGMVGEDRISTLRGCQWIIANYERLGGLVRETELAIAVLVVDEAHYLKEHQVARTRNAFILAERIPRRMLLTGTPLLNREVEIHTLLRLSGHPLGAMPLKEFRALYAGDGAKRAALAEQLRVWMLRRRKDVLKDLGKKHHQVVYVSPAEGRAGYDQVLADMTLQALPKIGRLRQTLEVMKVGFLVDLAVGLGQGDKLIIFAQFIPTVQVIRETCEAAGITCTTLIGSDTAAKRQKAVDAFQQDPRVRVFITTTAAGGVGITLTAANYVTFASEPWTAALKRQAEDRAYRLGQKRDVFVITLIVPRTIDENVHRLLEMKTELEGDVVDAVCTELRL